MRYVRLAMSVDENVERRVLLRLLVKLVAKLGHDVEVLAALFTRLPSYEEAKTLTPRDWLRIINASSRLIDDQYTVLTALMELVASYDDRWKALMEAIKDQHERMDQQTRELQEKTGELHYIR